MCSFENGSAACGMLKERSMKHCFQPEQFLFWRLGWLVSTMVDYRGNDSVTVVITTKIGLCSKWLPVVKSCILRNFPDAFPRVTLSFTDSIYEKLLCISKLYFALVHTIFFSFSLHHSFCCCPGAFSNVPREQKCRVCWHRCL